MVLLVVGAPATPSVDHEIPTDAEKLSFREEENNVTPVYWIIINFHIVKDITP
jgi:hypothetical protein